MTKATGRGRGRRAWRGSGAGGAAALVGHALLAQRPKSPRQKEVQVSCQTWRRIRETWGMNESSFELAVRCITVGLGKCACFQNV